VLAVAPVGPAPAEVLAAMEAALDSAFGLPVAAAGGDRRAGGGVLPEARAVELGRVPGGPPRPRAARGGSRAGVTERDLFVPVLSFVYGQASSGKGRRRLPGRLRPEFHGLPGAPAALARRAATEAVHEVGHTFGLVHLRRPPLPDVAVDRPPRPRRQDGDALPRLPGDARGEP